MFEERKILFTSLTFLYMDSRKKNVLLAFQQSIGPTYFIRKKRELYADIKY